MLCVILKTQCFREGAMVSRDFTNCMTAIAVLGGLAALALPPQPAYAAKKSGDGDTPVCSITNGKVGDDDGDDVSDSDSSGRRFFAFGTCYNASASIQGTGQAAEAAFPRARLGPPALQHFYVNPDVRLAAARNTAYGALTMAFEIDWTYYTDTGPDKLPNLDQASISYLGFTVGYDQSLMDFWQGDFQVNAFGPSLSSYLFNKEFKLSDTVKLAFGIEAGPPTSRGAESWNFPSTPPFYTTRLKYEKDDWTFQASAAFQDTDTSTTPLRPGTATSQLAWATTLGADLPVRLLADDDTVSLQATYSVNAPIFLGTAANRSELASIVPRALQVATTGWSGIASYQHNWNDKWTSNFFVSYLALEANTEFAHPSVESSRVAANLIYSPNDNWKLGAEIAKADLTINLNGVSGVLNGTSVSGKTGYLWTKWQW